ncbi:MAG: hypothetical protein HXX13_01470 [Bacteroidetes bacterium]|nr:hypothetical protein [Bacteroidota bacterium]
MKKSYYLVMAISLLLGLSTVAQDTLQTLPEANNPMWGIKKLMMTGGAETQFVADSGQMGFKNAKFHIAPLVSLGDKLFLISEIEIETRDGVADFGLEQVHLNYQILPNLTVYAGRFLPKFGHYRGMMGEGYLNRFSTDPVGFGDGGIGPMVENGVGIVGGLQLGYSKLNYDFYMSDGPQLLAEDATMAGNFEYEGFLNNNKNMAFGGRVGLLPFSNSCLELGVSLLHKSKTGDINTPFNKIGANWMAYDLNFYHNIPALKSIVRVYGEYKTMSVDKATYPFDEGGSFSTNKSSAWYIQGGLRPNGFTSQFVDNLEVSARYSSFTTPENAPWGNAVTYSDLSLGNTIHQMAYSLNYWLAWDCILKFSYQTQNYSANQFVFQAIYRF